jgi:hypothetical protein
VICVVLPAALTGLDVQARRRARCCLITRFRYFLRCRRCCGACSRGRGTPRVGALAPCALTVQRCITPVIFNYDAEFTRPANKRRRLSFTSNAAFSLRRSLLCCEIAVEVKAAQQVGNLSTCVTLCRLATSTVQNRLLVFVHNR